LLVCCWPHAPGIDCMHAWYGMVWERNGKGEGLKHFVSLAFLFCLCFLLLEKLRLFLQMSFFWLLSRRLLFFYWRLLHYRFTLILGIGVFRGVHVPYCGGFSCRQTYLNRLFVTSR
jgi:hypothetical protein